MLAYYFGYGANMSKRYLENIRNIKPVSSQSAYMLNYKLVINLKGPNFIEPAFANICYEENAKVAFPIGPTVKISTYWFERVSRASN